MFAAFALCLLLVVRILPLGQSGDGILLSVMSLQKITVYFWGQDRFGNLSPLLAAGFRDPLWNAWAQLGLRLVAGLLAPLFFCALAFRRPIDVWRATLVGDLLLLCAGGDALLHEIFVEANPYGLSLACAGLASLAVRRRDAGMTALALVALLAAYVVNVGLVIVTLPLAALAALADGWEVSPSPRLRRPSWPGLTRPSRRQGETIGVVGDRRVKPGDDGRDMQRTSSGAIALPARGAGVAIRSLYKSSSWRLLALHVLAAACAFLLPRIAARGVSRTPFGLHVALDPLLQYGDVIWHATGWVFMSAVALPLGALLGRSFRRRTSPVVAVAIAAMVIGAFGNFTVVASSRWLEMNGFNIRYAIPGLLMLTAAGGVALWSLARTLRMRRTAFAAAVVALALIASQRPREARDESVIVGNGRAALAQAVAERVVARSLDGVAGDYWDVWPSVFLAQQLRYDAGAAGTPVLGVTYRGEPMRAAFAARVAKGGVRLGCLDLATDDCVAKAESVMGMKLRGTEIAPAEVLAGAHRLGFVAVAAAG